MSRRMRLEDTLGEATSFVKAIRMCADAMSNAEGCAIDVLAEQVGLRIKEMHKFVDDMPMEEADARD